jgi:phosphoglycerate dehydrogenase-like enzyme
MPPARTPIILGEVDVSTRLVQLVLDPSADAKMRAAFADFFANDLPDVEAWCAQVRSKAANLYPAEVRMVADEAEFRAGLAEADGLIIESLPIGKEELAVAERLVVIQKYGVILRSIDVDACLAKGVKVLTLRRRGNIGVAEMAMSLMQMLAKKLNSLVGLVTLDRLTAAGLTYVPFDRSYTPNSNWARIPAIRMLYGTTLGIIGFGEVGREIAARATAFGMRVLYHQRTQLTEAEERALEVSYAPLEKLLAESDWVVPQLPSDSTTRGLLDRNRFAQMKPGAILVNVSRADVVDRDALIEALTSGRLAGFALDPLYEEPGRSDDELLRFDNVVLTPHIASQPRFNLLADIEDVIVGLAREIATRRA